MAPDQTRTGNFLQSRQGLYRLSYKTWENKALHCILDEGKGAFLTATERTEGFSYFSKSKTASTILNNL